MENQTIKKFEDLNRQDQLKILEEKICGAIDVQHKGLNELIENLDFKDVAKDYLTVRNFIEIKILPGKESHLSSLAARVQGEAAFIYLKSMAKKYQKAEEVCKIY